MANKSSIQTNYNREKLVKRYRSKRDDLKAKIMNKNTSPQERFELQVELAKLPRNGAKVRLRNRCQLTGRPRGYYRFFKLSRIMLRQLASVGMLTGVKKSSW